VRPAPQATLQTLNEHFWPAAHATLQLAQLLTLPTHWPLAHRTQSCMQAALFRQ